jgi:hypothetical protein
MSDSRKLARNRTCGDNRMNAMDRRYAIEDEEIWSGEEDVGRAWKGSRRRVVTSRIAWAVGQSGRAREDN